MTILISKDTKLLCQGITGRAATFHMGRAVAYGTQLVAGVRPGKGGVSHLDVPVFDRVADAVSETGADVSIVFVPPANAAKAMIEAIEAELPLVVCVTERVPVMDMVNVKAALRGSKTRLVGPNSQGVLAPGICKIGVMSTVHATPGTIGIVSRSASLTSEIVAQTVSERTGLSFLLGAAVPLGAGLGGTR